MAQLSSTDIAGFLKVNGDIELNGSPIEDYLIKAIDTGIHSSGGNSTGRWIRFDNRLQIVWALSPTIRSTSPALYNSFYTEMGMVFPSEFKEVPFVGSLNLRDSGIQWSAVRDATRTTADIYLIGGKHRSVTGQVGYFAFGRW